MVGCDKVSMMPTLTGFGNICSFAQVPNDARDASIASISDVKHCDITLAGVQ